MSVLALLQFVLLTVSLFTLACSLLVAALYPRLRRRVARLEPARRARVLTALAAAPLVVGVVHTAICFAPGVLGVVWPALDHCLYHSGHAHLCAVHLPVASGSMASWLLLGFFVALFGLPLALGTLRLVRGRRLLAQLRGAARPDATLGVHLVDDTRPFAATGPGTGILVSTALLKRLDAALLPAVPEHERAHLARRDPMLRAVATLLASAQLPWTRRRLLDDLELATEQACDEQAAACLDDDRLLVARALLAVERLMTAPTQLACAHHFGAAHLSARVESLLAPRQPATSSRVERGWLLVAVAVSVMLTDPLHHLAETIITMLVA